MMDKRPWESWDNPGIIDWLDTDWQVLGVDPALSALVDLVEIHHAGGPILDVGCGTGRIHEALMRRHVLRPHGYTGVDVTPGMVERARSKFPGVDFRVGDVFDLPFEDNAFGSVVCVDVLQHLPEIQRPITELLRVARDHVFLLLWLRKDGQVRVEPELVTIDVAAHQVSGCFYEVSYSDEEVIAACEAAGGKVLDFQVMDGETHDFGMIRVGVG